MTKKEAAILDRLVNNQDLLKSQIEFVKTNIEPKYENDCEVCRLNVMISLNVPIEEAFKCLNT